MIVRLPPGGMGVGVRVRMRFWAEVVMVALTAGLALLTLVERDWLEPLVGRDLDQGSGALEVLVVLLFLAATFTLSAAAWREWHRLQAGT